ncbi:1097_t:CDS:2, partial [Dentiscutata erythropus]
SIFELFGIIAIVNTITTNSALVNDGRPVVFPFNSLIISFVIWFIRTIPYPICRTIPSHMSSLFTMIVIRWIIITSEAFALFPFSIIFYNVLAIGIKVFCIIHSIASSLSLLLFQKDTDPCILIVYPIIALK